MDATTLAAIATAATAVIGGAVWYRLGALCQAVKDLARRVGALESGGRDDEPTEQQEARRRLRAHRRARRKTGDGGEAVAAG